MQNILTRITFNGEVNINLLVKIDTVRNVFEMMLH